MSEGFAVQRTFVNALLTLGQALSLYDHSTFRRDIRSPFDIAGSANAVLRLLFSSARPCLGIIPGFRGLTVAVEKPA